MATRIKLKRSEIPTSVPTVNDLNVGEVALNTFDQKLYVRATDIPGGNDDPPIPQIIEVANKGATDAEVTTKATIMAIALG